MKNFIYEGFACIKANEEEVLFSRNSGEIRIEHQGNLHKTLIPMKKYCISLFENNAKDDIGFRVKSFELDKFDNFIVEFRNANTHENLEIKMALDSYKNEDMENFVVGKKYDLKIE